MVHPSGPRAGRRGRRKDNFLKSRNGSSATAVYPAMEVLPQQLGMDTGARCTSQSQVREVKRCL